MKRVENTLFTIRLPVLRPPGWERTRDKKMLEKIQALGAAGWALVQYQETDTHLLFFVTRETLTEPEIGAHNVFQDLLVKRAAIEEGIVSGDVPPNESLQKLRLALDEYVEQARGLLPTPLRSVRTTRTDYEDDDHRTPNR